MREMEAIIGLEVHAQLKTKSKMFCGCATSFGDPPNTNICPICTGQPGTLPVANRLAVELAMRAGFAVGASIHPTSIFARKNYFYPDLPKGYQISQYESPLCTGGHIDISTADGLQKRISLIRIHLEEDAGKLTHDMGHPDVSHVDFNRCGVGLIEIVSGPDLRTPEEASIYLKRLRTILVYIDACEGNMQEGNLRCDANISVRFKGEKSFGTRTELKNMNSFKAVERALEYEIERQTNLMCKGESVQQATLLWNDREGKTKIMRTKEEAHDYRYFPDPDLLPLVISEAWKQKVAANLPELPAQKTARFIRDYQISPYDAGVLTAEKELADYYEKCLTYSAHPKKIANWIISELLRELNAHNTDIASCPIAPESLAALVHLIEEGTISGKMAKDVFTEMYSTRASPEKIVSAKGMQQVSNAAELETVINTVIAGHPDQVKKYQEGKAGLLAFFVGRVMRETKGKANPQMVNELLIKKLGPSL